MKTLALTVCLTLLVVPALSTALSFTAGSPQNVQARSLLQQSSGGDCSSDGLCDADLSCVVSSDTTDGTECTPVPNTSGRCICSPGPLPQYAFCELADAEDVSLGSAPCASGLVCSLDYYSNSGQCFPLDTLRAGQFCDGTGLGSPAGYACYEGLSCIQYDVSASGAYSTDYTYCSAESGVCVCSAGPIPVNDYCFIYGAPCEDGTYCDTGRADATGGYCTLIAQAVATEMTPTSAPALAPAPSAESTPEASTQANQECSATGNGCANGHTCLSLDDGEVCRPNSQSACQCYDEELPEGSRCDLYGAPWPFCGDGSSCIVASGTAQGSFCSFSSQACTCSVTTIPANAACQLYDSTAGFCLPVFWGTTVNTAGAGSSYGGVTGPWVGGTKGPNGAGGALPSVSYSEGSSASPPPPPPPPPKNATLRPVAKGAKTVYAVKATCTLHDVLLSDFQQAAYQKQFVQAMTTNIEALTGSPVAVTITNYTGQATNPASSGAVGATVSLGIVAFLCAAVASVAEW
ncbi:hypothetical protein WJX82_006776 [Trebouxia sp. C0006]